MTKKGLTKDIPHEFSLPEELHQYVMSLSLSTGKSISQTLYDIISAYYVGKQLRNKRTVICCNKEMSNNLYEIVLNSGFKNSSDFAVAAINMHMAKNNNQNLLINRLPDVGINSLSDEFNTNVSNITEKVTESLKYEVDYSESEITNSESVLNNALNDLQQSTDSQILITKDFFTKCSIEYIFNLIHGNYASYNSAKLRKPKDRKGIYDYCCFTNGCDDHFLETRQLLEDIGVEADPIETILIYLLTCCSNVDPYTSYEYYFDANNELHSWLKTKTGRTNIYKKVNILYNCWLQGIRILPAINTPCFAFLYYTFFNKAEYLCKYDINVMNTIDDMIPVMCIQKIVFRIIMTKFNRDVNEVFDEGCLQYLNENGII